METTASYEIRSREQLSAQWAEWFAPLVIHLAQSSGITLVSPIDDQAALHGVLVKLPKLNVTLFGVNKQE